MSRKIVVVMLGVLLSLGVTLVAMAAAPATGLVVEGVSVPSVALDDTRAQVEAAYGAPKSCTNRTNYDECKFDVAGGGRVTVIFIAPDGGPVQNSPNDEVSSISWELSVSGWVTTAGINTTIARDDPQAVLDAYPNAQVTYWYDGTFVAGVRDWELGISISRFWDFYCACAYASMGIFHPQDPPPPSEPAKYAYVPDIDLTAVKIKSNREITARVPVNDYQDQPAEGAEVSARWLFPDGTQQAVQGTTSSNGQATFMLTGKLDRGTYYLFIDDVQLTDHVWDYTRRGIRHASINVK